MTFISDDAIFLGRRIQQMLNALVCVFVETLLQTQYYCAQILAIWHRKDEINPKTS